LRLGIGTATAILIAVASDVSFAATFAALLVVVIVVIAPRLFPLAKLVDVVPGHAFGVLEVRHG
jgi:hypothetical protein